MIYLIVGIFLVLVFLAFAYGFTLNQPSHYTISTASSTAIIIQESSSVSYSSTNACSQFIAEVNITAVNFSSSGNGNLSFAVHNLSSNEIILNRLGSVPYNISIPAESSRSVALTNTGEPETQPPSFTVGFAPISGFSNEQVFGESCYIALPV